MTTLEPIVYTFIVLLSAVVVARVLRNVTREERTIFWVAYAAHVVAPVVHVLLTELYFGGGDSMVYMWFGGELARLIRSDPSTYIPLVVQMFFQVGQPEFPLEVFGIGHSTGSMHAVGTLMAILTDEGLYTTSLLVSLMTLWAAALVYTTFKRYFPQSAHPRIAISILLVPTTVFWNSGLLKEPFAITGLAIAIFGFDRWLDRQRTFGLTLMAFGFGVVALFKPYILFPAAVGLGLWFMARRAGGAHALTRPLYLALGAAAVFGGLLLLGRFFPRFAIERIAETTASQVRAGGLVTTGSYYSLGNTEELTVAGQLAYAPLGLFTALFRPLPFETRNAASFINALETMTLMILFLRAIVATSWSWAWRTIVGNPILIFCVSFVLVMAQAVGLSTTNFGTLSRYRSPFVPFLAAIVLPLGALVRARVERERAQLAERRARAAVPVRQ